MPDHPFAALCYALDAITGRTWHPDDDGAHTTGWIWHVEVDWDRVLVTTGTQLVAIVPVDPDPWTTAQAVAAAITAHTARIVVSETETGP